MRVETPPIKGLLLITPKRHGDARGFFAETFRADVFDAHAGPTTFVQDNQSRSAHRGTIRGLHYQRPPHAQGKLVRAVRGAILDVAVDIRRGSLTYGRHFSAELSEENGAQLWVPAGFLHGFCTLTEGAEVIYKTTDYYSPADEGAVAFDDPDLAIDWRLGGVASTVSDKDREAPRFADLPAVF